MAFFSICFVNIITKLYKIFFVNDFASFGAIALRPSCQREWMTVSFLGKWSRRPPSNRKGMNAADALTVFVCELCERRFSTWYSPLDTAPAFKGHHQNCCWERFHIVFHWKVSLEFNSVEQQWRHRNEINVKNTNERVKMITRLLNNIPLTQTHTPTHSPLCYI